MVLRDKLSRATAYLPSGFWPSTGYRVLTIDNLTYEAPSSGILVDLENPIDRAMFKVAVSIRDRILVPIHLTDLADQAELMMKALVDWM